MVTKQIIKFTIPQEHEEQLYKTISDIYQDAQVHLSKLEDDQFLFVSKEIDDPKMAVLLDWINQRGYGSILVWPPLHDVWAKAEKADHSDRLQDDEENPLID